MTERFTTPAGLTLSYERRGGGPLLVCHPGGPGGSAAEFRDFAGRPPAGTKREIAPVLDIHVGLVDSSLGGHGSDSCSTAETQGCGAAGNGWNLNCADQDCYYDTASGCAGPATASPPGAAHLLTRSAPPCCTSRWTAAARWSSFRRSTHR